MIRDIPLRGDPLSKCSKYIFGGIGQKFSK
jgi:hypothetical protein